MSQTKREQVVSHLRYLRQELRGILAQMEALLELCEGNPKSKAAPEIFSN